MAILDKSDRFLAVVDDHKGIINRVALSWTSSPEDKQDLVQEITLQLWRAFDKYDSQFKYSTWVYRIALNVALAFSRRQQNRKRLFDPMPDTLIEMPATGGSEGDDDSFNRLQQIVSRLKELDRALILLYFDGHTQREMAEIMGMTETNVSTRISRIKSSLRENFLRTKN